jgi:hypothetical protein
MHRSGTSLCSHMLSALGVDMSDTIAGPGHTSPTPENPRGHWERWEIVEFHDRILSLFNREYLGRFHDFALPVAWWADPRVVQIRREIVAFLGRRMGGGYFGFKDPRMVRLMPVWHQIFNELEIAPKLVLCLRNPAQVARSLNVRDGLDAANGEYRWLVHMIDFFRYTNKLDFCAVEYEEWFDNPAANLEKLQKFLGLQWQQSEADLALLLSDLIDRTSRHDDPNYREAKHPLVRSLYKLIGHSGQEAAARDQIAYIVSQFVSFQQLQTPLQQAFEDIAKTAAKYPQIEKEATGLRALVDEREAGIAAAEKRASGAEARLADTLAKLEGQRAQNAELAGERAKRAEIERAATELKATLAEREASLREYSRRADEFGAALRAAEAQVATYEGALERAEREVQERRAATLALESEIRALRQQLAQAQQVGAEVMTVRQKLAQAEREARERAAVAIELQAEIVEKQDMLTAARRVGKAAIAAFHIETGASAKPNRPGGWWQGIMRFFGPGPSFSVGQSN